MASSPLQSDDMEAIRRHLRSYEQSLDRARRKRFGQFFTGRRASSLLAALSLTGEERTIVDPMAGHGDLLEAASERSALLEQRVALTGVEIDEPIASLADERLSRSSRALGHSLEVLNRDAFTPELWKGPRAIGAFDLVIANPPYVRYQSHSVARANEPIPTTLDTARRALRAIAQSAFEGTERQVWTALIDRYSGLADLSVPSWILCAMLVKPGGTLALVVPQTWMNRDYATLIQYLQLRFFEPRCIVEEHGVSWFEDALVPTTLVVSRRLSNDDAIVPLTRRSASQSPTVVAAVRPTAADARSLVGQVFPGSDPDIAFARWLRNAETSARPHITVRHLSWVSQVEAVLARSRNEQWFDAVGESSEVSVGTAKNLDPTIPSAITHALEPFRPAPCTTLERLRYEVGQGLRTGCNGFFYADAIGVPANGYQTVRVSDIFGGARLPVPQELLRSVVRRQSDVPGFAVEESGLSGRVLILRGWVLPEDSHRGSVKVLPPDLASFVRRAATTSVGPSDRRVLIPDLSAVRTNARAKPLSDALFDDESTNRCWYMLPDFAPRHQPAIAMPRVNSGTPYAFLNSHPPTLIDANFSTIYGASPVLAPFALLAILNSTWCRVCAECVGTPMGGGALKFEATQLRTLPMPELTANASVRLTEIGRSLAARTEARTDELLPEIDAIVFGELFPIPQEAESAHNRLQSLLAQRREQRVRAPKEAAL